MNKVLISKWVISFLIIYILAFVDTYILNFTNLNPLQLFVGCAFKNVIIAHYMADLITKEVM